MDDIYISGRGDQLPIEFVDLDLKPPAQQAPPEPPPKKKRKKKHRPLRTLLKIVIAVLLVLTVLITSAAAAIGYTRENLKRNQYVSIGSLSNSPLVTNILLLGIDEDAEGSTRADSMILLSVDYAHFKLKLTSFLRDCRVEIPSRESKAKLNAAYAYGGTQLAVDTIEYNFGVNIDHYVKVDFEMFTRIIDRLGGVDVEVTEKEAQFINRTTRHTVDSGPSVHLDGAKALVYCRIRKLDTDYMRTYRQRKVIEAVINKAKRTDPATLLSAARDVIPMLTTDLSPLEITLLFYQAVPAVFGFEMLQSRVPSDKNMTAGMVNGQWVEEPDLDAVRRELHDFIYTAKTVDAEEE